VPEGPVVVPVNVCPLVAWTARVAGREVVFADLDPVTLDMRRPVCPSPPAALVYVRPYGATLSRHEVFAGWRAAWPATLIVDDACLAVPELDADACEPDADMTLFSTGHSKSVALGAGGYAWCSDRAQACLSQPLVRTMTRELRTGCHRWTPDGPVEELVCAGAPGPDWPAYADRIRREHALQKAHRDRLNAVYASGLLAASCLAPAYRNWRFHVFVKDPATAIATLQAHRLFASRHFVPLSSDRERYPHAWHCSDHVINLFNDRSYTSEMGLRTCEVLQPHLASV